MCAQAKQQQACSMPPRSIRVWGPRRSAEQGPGSEIEEKVVLAELNSRENRQPESTFNCAFVSSTGIGHSAQPSEQTSPLYLGEHSEGTLLLTT